ncbi:MAG: helix-turn-helix domain-containing protein [Dehalococcoidia bacterium]
MSQTAAVPKKRRIAPDDRRCEEPNANYSNLPRSFGEQRKGQRCAAPGTEVVDGRRLCHQHAKHARGEVITKASRKLTMAQAGEIRARVAAYRERLGLLPSQLYGPKPWEQEEYGVCSLRALAQEYGVSICAISQLVNGKTYRDVPVAPVRVRRPPRLTPAQKQCIRARWVLGESARSIARVFGVSHETIWNTVRGLPRQDATWDARTVRRLREALARAEQAIAGAQTGTTGVELVERHNSEIAVLSASERGVQRQ